MKRAKISVVVPVYNEQEYLEKCLKSLKSQDYKGEFEIIVVDSSEDESFKIAKKFDTKLVKFPKSTPAEARQAGFAASTGEIIATIDADNQASPSWLSQIEKEFRNGETVCLFGAISPLEGKFQDRALLFFYNIANLASLKILGFPALTGTNQAIRRPVFAKIGGFEPIKLPNTHADIFDQTFLFSRLRKLGKVKFDFGMQVRFSMRKFHQNGYLATFAWGARQWLTLHVWQGFGFSKLAPLKFSTRIAIAVILASFAATSAIVLNFALNGAEAEFDTKVLREKIANQVALVKSKTQPVFEKVENFEISNLLK